MPSDARDLPARAALTLNTHAPVPDGAAVLVAVSGGADSMALLHVLRRLGDKHRWNLHVAHLDHGLRGEEGRADAAFVRAAAAGLGVPFTSGRADVRRLARASRQSMEMAGRAARRDFLERTGAAVGAAVAALGHNADDRVETLLLNMARGAGMRSLLSIPYRSASDGGRLTLVRPLLDADRGAILAWLRDNGIAWREDRENRNPAYLRNRVRHELLPWLESRLNPRVRRALLRLMEQAAIEEDLIRHLAVDAARKCLVERPDGTYAPVTRRLAAYPAALRRRVIADWLQSAGLAAPRIDSALIGKLDLMVVSGRPARLTLAAGRRALLDNGVVIVAPESGGAPFSVAGQWKLPENLNGTVAIAPLGICVRAAAGADAFRPRGGSRPGRLPATAVIRLPRPGEEALSIRCRRAGDRMRPAGCGGTRKLQDILTDAGVPRADRGRIPLLVSGDTLVWLPGYRIAEGWRAPAEAPMSLRIDIFPANNPD